MRHAIGLVLILVPAVVEAQAPPGVPPQTAVVAAHGAVETAPDTATVSLTIAGEGRTPDDATMALAKRLTAVREGLLHLDRGATFRTGSIGIGEVYAGPCQRGAYGTPIRPVGSYAGDPCAVVA